MFAKTDTENAPWCLIPGNDKLYARIQVLKEIIAHIEKEVARRGLQLTNIIGNQEEVATDEEMVEIKATKKSNKKNSK